MDEANLISKAKGGDTEAFEKLIESSKGLLFNLALKLLQNQDDAEEATQEVLLKMYKNISGFKGDSAFNTWAYRVMHNYCMDLLRKNKNKKNVSLDERISYEEASDAQIQASQEDSPERQAEKNELKKIVRGAIAKLPESQRELIVLRDIEGLGIEEISKITSLPNGTIKSRLNRARLKLRDILAKHRELF